MSKCAFCGFTLTDLDHRLSPECPDCGQPLCCHCLESLGVLAAEYAEQAKKIERLEASVKTLSEFPETHKWRTIATDRLAEVERLQAEVKGRNATAVQYEKDAGTAWEKVERLQADLKLYGGHVPTCPESDDPLIGRPSRCDCGWGKRLGELCGGSESTESKGAV